MEPGTHSEVDLFLKNQARNREDDLECMTMGFGEDGPEPLRAIPGPLSRGPARREGGPSSNGATGVGGTGNGDTGKLH